MSLTAKNPPKALPSGLIETMRFWVSSKDSCGKASCVPDSNRAFHSIFFSQSSAFPILIDLWQKPHSPSKTTVLENFLTPAVFSSRIKNILSFPIQFERLSPLMFVRQVPRLRGIRLRPKPNAPCPAVNDIGKSRARVRHFDRKSVREPAAFFFSCHVTGRFLAPVHHANTFNLPGRL